MIRLCDKTGWTYGAEKPKIGSLMNISWSYDGTMVAAGGGNGTIAFAYVIERESSQQNLIVCLTEFNKITISDEDHEITEDLEFKDKVINFSLGFNNLIVTSSSQCYIYNTSNMHTPHILDIKDSNNMIVQANEFFCLVDVNNGMQVYIYEGRLMSSPRY